MTADESLNETNQPEVFVIGVDDDGAMAETTDLLQDIAENTSYKLDGALATRDRDEYERMVEAAQEEYGG